MIEKLRKWLGGKTVKPARPNPVPTPRRSALSPSRAEIIEEMKHLERECQQMLRDKPVGYEKRHKSTMAQLNTLRMSLGAKKRR